MSAFAHLMNNCVTFVLRLTAVQHIKHRQFEFYFREAKLIKNAGFITNLPALDAFSHWSTDRPSLTAAGSLPTEKRPENFSLRGAKTNTVSMKLFDTFFNDSNPL